MSDQIRIEIDHQQWHEWWSSAVRARITQEGMSGLLELRIAAKARARGATLSEQPRLWLRRDPIALVVHARGEGLTPELVREAVAEMTAEAEIAAEAEAAFMASMTAAPPTTTDPTS